MIDEFNVIEYIVQESNILYNQDYINYQIILLQNIKKKTLSLKNTNTIMVTRKSYHYDIKKRFV